LIKCWGFNSYGQLGYGDVANRGHTANTMGNYLQYVNLGSGLTAETIHCGEFHTCVVLSDNSLKCWGLNDFGQLVLIYFELFFSHNRFFNIFFILFWF